MTVKLMTVDEAIGLLKRIVKYSAVPGQKHLDFTLVNAPEREKYELAMIIVKKAVQEGHLKEIELKSRLGLN